MKTTNILDYKFIKNKNLFFIFLIKNLTYVKLN